MPSYNKLLEAEPVDRPDRPGGDEQAAADPVPDRRGRHVKHRGHHRRGVEASHARMIHGIVELKQRPG